MDSLDLPSARLKRRLQEIDDLLTPLERERAQVTREWAVCLSREFIAANGITRDDVVTTNEHEIPWHHVSTFVKWLADTRCEKRWAEWNGRLHLASDLIAGRFIPTPAYLEHVPEAPNS